MKALDFKDVEGTYEDVDGDTQTSTVRAAIVDDSTAFVSVLNNEGDRVKRRREVTLRDGTARALSTGDVVIETERPGVYDVLSAAQWSETGYGKASVQQDARPDLSKHADDGTGDSTADGTTPPTE